MKLPDALLSPQPKESYTAMDGDIEIATLMHAQSNGERKEVAGLPKNRPRLFTDDFELTAAGLRALNVLKSFKETERMKILRFLVQAERSVGLIAEHLETTQPAVSHHLKLLHTEGLLNLRRDGKFNIYSISEECKDAVGGLIDQLRTLGQEEEMGEEVIDIGDEEQSIGIKMLAEKMRMQIFQILHLRGEGIVTDFCKILEQSQPGVSHHLGLLRGAKLLSSRVAGKLRPYVITREGKLIFRRIAENLESLFFGKEDLHRNEQAAEEGKQQDETHDENVSLE